VLRVGHGAAFPANNMVRRIRWGGPWISREELNAEHYKPHADVTRARMRHRGGMREWQLGVVTDQPYGGKRAPLIEVHDWREALVVVASHEARHVHQFRHGKPRSEVDAERFAAKALERYRLARRQPLCAAGCGLVALPGSLTCGREQCGGWHSSKCWPEPRA
jgi:hypothetical protein